MKYRTFDELAPVAHVVPVGEGSRRTLRCHRLERMATALDDYLGILRLFSRVEYLPHEERQLLRADCSPLTVAYQDPMLRQQGLSGDRIGDAMRFFDLSWHEAHHLFCDCHYLGEVTSKMVAERLRTVARRRTWGDICHEYWQALVSRITSR
jgi:hypothetical protein